MLEIVGEKLLLGDRGEFHVDWLGVVIEGGRLAQYGKRACERGDHEDPQKESIDHHCDKAPVLILLQNIRVRLVCA